LFRAVNQPDGEFAPRRGAVVAVTFFYIGVGGGQR